MVFRSCLVGIEDVDYDKAVVHGWGSDFKPYVSEPFLLSRLHPQESSQALHVDRVLAFQKESKLNLNTWTGFWRRAQHLAAHQAAKRTT